MSVVATPQSHRSAFAFAAGMTVFAMVGLCLAASLPFWMSMAIVFLFAGPHNYVEARYFLTRLPARAGRLRGFFAFSACGILTLSMSFPLLMRLPAWFGWDRSVAVWIVGIWNTAFLLWVINLVAMRAHQPPRRSWDYAWPIGFAVIGCSWLNPLLLPLLLVYLHPLAGLWVLDREIAARRPGWQRGYRFWLLLIPVLTVALWFLVPNVATQQALVSDAVHRQISRHSGAVWFSETVGHRLIATHAFLELLHYGIWIVVIPVASGRVFYAGFQQIPLMKVSDGYRHTLRIGLAVLAFIVGVLWLCFTLDYGTTRDVYFTVATVHVLAEIPFLLRLL